MWPRLGWFCGLVCVGSVAGAAAWGAQMQFYTLQYLSQATGPDAHTLITHQQYYILFAASLRWNVAFLFLYPIEFLCLIASKLMLLGRLTRNAARIAQVQVPEVSGGRPDWQNGRALQMMFRTLSAAGLLCTVASMVASYVAGVYFVQAAALQDRAAAACDALGRNTNASLALFTTSTTIILHADTSISFQSILEAAVLTFISLAFALIVTFSVAAFRRAEQVAACALVAVAGRRDVVVQNDTAAAAVAIVDDTMHAAAEQRRRLTAACIVVLITFPARAAFDFLFAYSNFNVEYNAACAPCDSCQSNQFLVDLWLNYTPEFQPIVVALSSPLPLTVSLWIITTAHARALDISLNVKAMRARVGNIFGRADATDNRIPLI